jgi:hypothetical protein
MARAFQPVGEKEMKSLIAKSEKAGSEGELEPWKTTNYGSRYHREQHEGVS